MTVRGTATAFGEHVGMTQRSPLRNALVAVIAVLSTIGVGAVSAATFGNDRAEYCGRVGCGD